MEERVRKGGTIKRWRKERLILKSSSAGVVEISAGDESQSLVQLWLAATTGVLDTGTKQSAERIEMKIQLSVSSPLLHFSCFHTSCSRNRIHCKAWYIAQPTIN